MPNTTVARYASPIAAGGRTDATPASWKFDPTGTLTEAPPALDLLQPDIAYLAKIVADSCAANAMTLGVGSSER